MMERRRISAKGFGLLELMITLVIASLLVSIAVPAYDRYTDRAKTMRAIGDIAGISVEIAKFQLKNNNALPASLAELPIEVRADPWGNEYRYFNIAAAGAGVGDFRKDKNLNPLNTDFDLYSVGEDGQTASALTAKTSRDDVVRANDGAFIGRGEDY